MDYRRPKTEHDSFSVFISLGNEAMRSRQDVARALREIAKRLEENDASIGRIHDANGNSIGEFILD